MLGRPQHVTDRLWSMALKKNGYTEACTRQNASSNIQWTDFGLRVVKTYGNAESHAGRKKKILGRQQMTMLKVVTKRVPKHLADIL